MILFFSVSKLSYLYMYMVLYDLIMRLVMKFGNGSGHFLEKLSLHKRLVPSGL